ncbi:hypothetical protein B296_00047058 [Ensete ventricosum]|uniref:Uncharacterized protein n=1 Tax=Ensete ventricosum TaxID=4639 RepID=A0A426X5H3_ENSVE|nr:hypothetical protein B296_00047058 [Ensete ventricosum]
MYRPVEPKPPNWTANKKVAGLPTFIVGKRPADSKIDSGGEVVIATTLAKAKARHEQVPSRDNPGPSALAQKDDKVAPRVGRYLAGGDSPPPQALLDEWMQRKSETDLQSIHRDPHAGSVKTIGALPGLRNVFLRTLASIGDGGPEDAPNESSSGSHRLISPDPGEEMTLTLLEESDELPEAERSATAPKASERIKCAIALAETLS